MGLAAALQPARADGDVGAVGDGGKQALGLLDGRREVGVGEHDHLAERLQHAVAHAVALAAVAGIFKQPDLGRTAGQMSRTTSAVASVEPSLTTMTSASQPLARMQATTASSVAGMRALSLKAGITMLYFGILRSHPRSLRRSRFAPAISGEDSGIG